MGVGWGWRGGGVSAVSKTNTNPCSYPVPVDLRGKNGRKGSGRREKQEKGRLEKEAQMSS